MAFIIDNLTAVIVGGILLVTMLTLQMRDRQEAVADTISHGVRQQLYGAIEIGGEDLENMRSPDAAAAEAVLLFDASASLDPDDLSWDADTLGSGSTGRFRFPTSVRLSDTPTDRALAEVTYTLIPSMDTVHVAGAVQYRHTLVRTASFVRLSPNTTPDTQVDTLSHDLISLRLGFVSGVVEENVTRQGDAPTSTHSVSLSTMAARPGPADLSTEVRNVGFSNAVSYGGTFTPKNL